jgi:membrane-associated phospholipid phosphatase
MNDINLEENSNNVLWKLMRMFPEMFPFFCFIIYLATSDNLLLYIIIVSYINFLLNTLFKNISSRIYKIQRSVNIPIIGRGPRPLGSHMCDFGHKQSFGMPSGHAQITWTFVVLVILLILQKKGGNYDLCELKHLGNIQSKDLFRIICLVLLGITVCYSRVYVEGCHTLEQVIVGTIIGISLGVFFFKMMKNININININIEKNENILIITVTLLLFVHTLYYFMK